MSIKIFYDRINYRLKDKKEVLMIIQKVIRSYKRVTGDLSFIITGDSEIISLNKEFLGKNRQTDVIAFDYNAKKTINGEVYISIETIKRNANNYKVSLRCELTRVMIHGTLHLCGLNDESENERALMRMEEDKYLKMIFKRI